MRLYLVQHGEALPKEVDPERALSTDGRADVERLAAFLEKKETIARILHSGKLRARQTAEILGTKIAPEVAIEVTTGIDPLDDPQPLVRQVGSWEKNVMVVGHLPFLSKFVSLLVAGKQEAESVTFLPGSLVCLERTEGNWTVVSMLRPESLKCSSE